MIVKNEDHIIERALLSALPQMDTFCIVDTGSTDKTKEIIQRVSDTLGIKGYIYTRPWVNFGHNRTEALELARNHMSWAFMLDADDVLEGIINRELLKEDIGGYTIQINEGSIINNRTSLTNLKYNWKYKGALHEYPYSTEINNIQYLPNTVFIKSKREGSRSNDPQKYLKDALILQKEYEFNPDSNKGRTLFYLAQSYRDAGLKDMAIKYYNLRSISEGWIEENYISFLNLIRLTDSIDEKLDYAWLAQEVCPTRKECIYEILQYARKKDIFQQEIYALGYTFFNIVSNKSSLFLEEFAYGWSYFDEFGLQAFYTKHFIEALQSFAIAKQICPEEHKERIQKNIELCLQNLPSMPEKKEEVLEEFDTDLLEFEKLEFDNKLKIIATMTTIPSRIDKIKDTIQTILNQTIPIEHLEINIPYKCIRTNEEYIIPEWLTNMKNVKIFRTEDYGAITKVAPTFIRYRNNSEIYIWSVDDDLIYPNNTLELYTYGYTPFFNEARGYWCFNDTYVEHGCNVKFLQGFSSILYSPNIIKNDFEEYLTFILENKECKNDDLMIGNYLAKHNILRKLYRPYTINFLDSNVLKEYGNTKDALKNIYNYYDEYNKETYKFLKEYNMYYFKEDRLNDISGEIIN